MIEIASQIVICLLIAAFIGFLIGFVVGGASGKTKSSNSSTPHSGAASGNIYNKPLIRSSARPSGKDDLQKIEGIDSLMEDRLNELGIFHFDQIVKWSPKNCHWLEEYLTLESDQIKEGAWIEQAESFARKP